MFKQIQKHPNFNVCDYSYLKAKGWTNEEILARWDEEHKAGKGPCNWAGKINQGKLSAVINNK